MLFTVLGPYALSSDLVGAHTLSCSNRRCCALTCPLAARLLPVLLLLVSLLLLVILPILPIAISAVLLLVISSPSSSLSSRLPPLPCRLISLLLLVISLVLLHVISPVLLVTSSVLPQLISPLLFLLLLITSLLLSRVASLPTLRLSASPRSPSPCAGGIPGLESSLPMPRQAFALLWLLSFVLVLDCVDITAVIRIINALGLCHDICGV